MESIVKKDLEEKPKDEKNEKIENTYNTEEKTVDNLKEEVADNTEKFKKVEKDSKKLNKEINNMDNSPKRKKWIVASIIIGIILIIGIFISTVFALLNINNNKIMSGISISGVDVSGLTKEEALLKMQTIYNEKKEKEIGIKYKDYETTLNPTIMEVNYDIESAVDEAYLIGKKDNIIVNNYNILFALIGKKNIEVNMTLNEDISRQTIEDIGVNLPGVVIESSYSIENDELIITKGKEGIYIDTEAVLNKLKESLKDINIKEDYIEIEVINKKPDPIDIEKIYEEIHKEPQDAYYTTDPFAVYPEVEGIDFNLEEAKQLLLEEKKEYVVKLTITKPKITIDQIGTEAFPDRLAIFTTRYDASDTNRTTNLVIACQKINEKVVLAGETFSYNQALGPRTVAAGYKNAKIYEAGQVVDGLGGGICQISSTLYNSVLMANLEIVERRNHQFVTSYVPAGRDATVVYGLTDFKFKNTREYPIRIVASAKNGIATVSIYGIKEENEYTFSFNTKTVASIPFSTKYVEDSSLSVGTEKIKQKGANGLKTETYITKMLNGKVISTTLLSKDTYDAMTKIIIKGTKSNEAEKPVNVENVTTQPEEEKQPTTQEPIKPETEETTNPTDSNGSSIENDTTTETKNPET